MRINYNNGASIKTKVVALASWLRNDEILIAIIMILS
jgi:hypothetical protein